MLFLEREYMLFLKGLEEDLEKLEEEDIIKNYYKWISKKRKILGGVFLSGIAGIIISSALGTTLPRIKKRRHKNKIRSIFEQKTEKP